MGKRGPSPKPTALRILQGNPGKIKLNPTEPQPIRAEIDLPPPTWLNQQAREVWLRLRPELLWLAVVDLDLFAGYCTCYSRWRQAEDWLESHGLTFFVREPAGPNGEEGAVKFIQQWPHVAIAKQSLAHMVKIAGELGLSPASRSRIHVEPEKNQADKHDEMMFG